MIDFQHRTLKKISWLNNGGERTFCTLKGMLGSQDCQYEEACG